jgi:hypothetical protein
MIEVEVGAARPLPFRDGTLRSILSQAHIDPDDWDTLG